MTHLKSFCSSSRVASLGDMNEGQSSSSILFEEKEKLIRQYVGPVIQKEIIKTGLFVQL